MSRNLFDENPYNLHYDDNNLLNIDEYDNTVILDFFDMVSYICYTDFYTKRDEDIKNINKLTVGVPVNNIEKFNNIKKDIEILLKYMTNGEEWRINFEKQEQTKILRRKQKNIENSIKYDSVCVLSGGLDSMAGSVIENKNKTIFVTYGTNFIEVNNAKMIYNNLIKNECNKHIIVKKQYLEYEEHYAERTRSLIFIASALIFADYYNINCVKIYENGIMSLNPKFNFSRRVTKTTNQKTLFYINTILYKLGINIKVVNPFKYKTKADVIKIIPEEYASYIEKSTRTCSKNAAIIHFRNKSNGNFHCGICIACILRQIGMINNDRKDATYLLPENLIKLEDIFEYEKKISKKNNNKNDEKAAIYKFNEKRSLIEYYKEYYKHIDNDTIYDYLDLKKEYYEDEEWFNEIQDMLGRFKKELEEYFKQMKE